MFTRWPAGDNTEKIDENCSFIRTTGQMVEVVGGAVQVVGWTMVDQVQTGPIIVMPLSFVFLFYTLLVTRPGRFTRVAVVDFWSDLWRLMFV